MKGVISYRDGRVFLKHDSYYRVGELGADWKRMRGRARAIAFYNSELASTIATDGFCGRALDKRGIELLGGEMVGALKNSRTRSERSIQIAESVGQRKLFSGELEGRSVTIDLVTLKSAGCVLDFYAVMPGEISNAVEMEFEKFLNGVELPHTIEQKNR